MQSEGVVCLRILWESLFISLVTVRHAARLTAGLGHLQSVRFDAVLLDPLLPDGAGAETIEVVRNVCNGAPVIVVSGEAAADARNRAVRAGAHDFLRKDQLDPDRLLRTIRYSVEHAEHETTVRHLEYARYQFSLARELQQHLFPREAPQIPGYDLCGRCWPADATGGDFFDFIPHRGRFDLCIGDAAGHGMVAAMMVTIVRSVMRSLLAVGQPLDRLVPLVRQIAGPDFPSTRFVSLLVASLKPSSGAIWIVSAGQPAMVFGPDGHLRTRIAPQYPVIMLDVPADTAPLTWVKLARGEILLLYTDGITEAPSAMPGLYGQHRMEEVVRQCHQSCAESILESLLNDVTRFRDGLEQRDDMTLVVLKRDP